MKLTRERKIIGAVLVIALGGLGFDQLRGSASADASSTDAGSLLLASSGSSHKPAPTSAGAAEDVSLATRLATLAHTTGKIAPKDIRDVFRPADVWIVKPAGSISTVTAADKFALDHKLTTISTNAAGGGVVVVDGKLLHMGGRIDGYRLVAINGQSATFASPDGAQAQLKLPAEPIVAGR